MSAPAQAPVERPKRKHTIGARGTVGATDTMVPVPAGAFSMGSDEDPSEKPIHQVTIKSFAIGTFPITVREWNACVAAKSCSYAPTGKDDAPVTNLSWTDTQQLWNGSPKLRKSRFGFQPKPNGSMPPVGGLNKFWWGDQLQASMANCKGCNEPYETAQPLNVGSFKPNPFGLYDMGGNIHQWVADCWHENYQARLRMVRHGWKATACRASSARDRGKTIRVTFDRPTGITTTRPCTIPAARVAYSQ